MKTGSLRARVILTTLALLAIVLAAVVTAVTLAYRAKLNGDLRNRLAAAGAAVERAGSAPAVKPLIPGLALEGIATRFSAAPGTGPTKTGSTIRTRGSLLVLDEVLPDQQESPLAPAARASTMPSPTCSWSSSWSQVPRSRSRPRSLSRARAPLSAPFRPSSTPRSASPAERPGSGSSLIARTPNWAASPPPSTRWSTP